MVAKKIAEKFVNDGRSFYSCKFWWFSKPILKKQKSKMFNMPSPLPPPVVSFMCEDMLYYHSCSLVKCNFPPHRWWQQSSRTTGCPRQWTVPWCYTSWCWSAGWRRGIWGPNSPASSVLWTSCSATPPASKWWPAPTQGEFSLKGVSMLGPNPEDLMAIGCNAEQNS